ncbi:hypothetical protein Bra5_PB00262 (plasmid) [Rhizobium phaseoli Brasil 5]|nr:hypothetical protein Bra5_PB00262 [Rhizobium phaseoli Brasil 5]ARO26942.1 hypothetical protein TAL182_PC00339 [Rhizobium sp. TAL182]
MRFCSCVCLPAHVFLFETAQESLRSDKKGAPGSDRASKNGETQTAPIISSQKTTMADIRRLGA